MLSHKGIRLWRNGVKSVFVPPLRASYSSAGQTKLDQQIQEMNQELETVFGPSDNGERSSPFSSSCSSTSPPLPSSSSASSMSGCNHKTVLSVDPLHRTNVLSHVDAHGKASMVDVSEKVSSKRVAIASGKVLLGPVVFPLVSANQISKGDVLTVAKIAGICGAKQTGNLIPLCHNIPLSDVQLSLKLNEEETSVVIKAEVSAVGTTGVEMEALTAVSVAALTVYDMCKAVSKHVTISHVQLELKTGGKSGHWCRSQGPD